MVRHYRGLGLGEAGRRAYQEVIASPKRNLAVYALVATAWVTLIVWGRLILPLATTPYAKPLGAFHVVAFFENGAGPFYPDSFPVLRQNYGLFDIVSPFWHSVDPAGEIASDGFRPGVVREARSRGLKIIPLVNNAKDGAGNSWDAIRTHAARSRTVANLAALAEARGYDGLNIGFELLPPEARLDYAAFIDELASALRTQGQVLAVSAFSDVELPPVISGFFDYERIGQAADYVILLGYDRHWTNTQPGPVSPLPWVEASIDSLLKHVPARKVILAIGTHAYDWPQDRGAGLPEYLPTATALDRAAEAGAEVVNEEPVRQRFFTYLDSTGAAREVWVQDAGHIADKLLLARRKGLRGVAIWRLGFSEPGALDTLARALGRWR